LHAIQQQDVHRGPSASVPDHGPGRLRGPQHRTATPPQPPDPPARPTTPAPVRAWRLGV